ncbi:GDSL-type esterase/lipase family protein [Paenibacillus tarimensis]
MKPPSNGSAVLWKTIGVASLAATLLLIFGFAYAVYDITNPSAANQDEAEQQAPDKQPSLSDQDEIRITAIGDSLTKGTGDNTGQGYVRQVIDGLSEKLDKPVKLINNLALNGLRADELADKLESDNGMQFALRQANVILLTIGGNDLFQFAQGTGAGQTAEEIRVEHLSGGLEEGAERLAKVFKLLNEINPEARIVYVGLYNPFYDMEDLREGSLQVQDWNREAYKMSMDYPNISVIPTFDLFEHSIGSYLSSDHFHPNHAGYGQIAARIVQILE